MCRSISGSWLPPAPGLDHVAAEDAPPAKQPDPVTTSSTPHTSSTTTTTISSGSTA